VQNARVKQAFAAYQQTVVTSLEETENALVNYADEQSRRDHLEATVRASQEALNLATDQYRAGLTDFLTVLDSERTLFANQDLLAQSQTALVVDLVTLYKALGGGWQDFPPPLSAKGQVLQQEPSGSSGRQQDQYWKSLVSKLQFRALRHSRRDRGESSAKVN